MDAMAIELREQGELWARLWRRRGEAADLLAAFERKGIRRILLTGCGDCHAAAEFGEVLWGLRSGFEVRAFPAMELSRARTHLLDPGTLVVALSVSGRTPRVLEALHAARGRGASTAAITDDPGSPVGTAADASFGLQASPPETLSRSDYRDPEAARYVGYQRSVPQTKTYGAMQFALAMLGLELEKWCPSGRGSSVEEMETALAELPQVADQVEEVSLRAARAFLEATRPYARVAICGTGPNRATARFAAYKFLELACPAAHGEIEEFCHTSYLVTEARDGVLFLCQDEATRHRISEIIPVLHAEIGAGALALGTGPPAGEPWLFSVASAPPELSPLFLGDAVSHVVREIALAWRRNVDRFRAGLDEERYVRGSTRMIRESEIRTP